LVTLGDLSDPAQIAVALRRLANEHNGLSASFEARVAASAREQAIAMVREQNAGHGDLQIVNTNLSAKQHQLAQQYDMDDDSVIPDWRRGSLARASVLDSPPSREVLRRTLFECDMQADGRARLLRAGATPSIWSKPPLLSAADRITYGKKRCALDAGYRDKQIALLKTIAPMLQAFSSGGQLRAKIVNLSEHEGRPLLDLLLLHLR